MMLALLLLLITTATTVTTVTTTRVTAKTQSYAAFPRAYASRANATSRPRLLLSNAALLDALRRKWGSDDPAAVAFQARADGLKGASCASNYFCDQGYGAALLSLAYVVSGDEAYGQSVCDEHLAIFTGTYANVGGNWMADTNWALVYDWLHSHSCFTASRKQTLRNKLISFSNGAAAESEKPDSSIAHDSDMNNNAVQSHLLGCLAILGDGSDDSATQMCDRGWTGLMFGFDANDALPAFPVVDMYRNTSGSGLPLPGYEYGPGDDVPGFQPLLSVLDDLGVVDDAGIGAAIKDFFPNAIENFIRFFDPAWTHWHWYSDTQDDTTLQGQAASALPTFISMLVYWAERFGFPDQASSGRFFLDTFLSKRNYIASSDEIWWFLRSWNSSAPRVAYTVNASNPAAPWLNAVSGLCTDASQRTGVATFRSAWTSTKSPADAKQVTWGGMTATGYYVQDHMQPDFANVWFWRNGEYLLTDIRSYSGPEVTAPFNSLGVVTPAHTGFDLKAMLPVYDPAGAPFMARGRARRGQGLIYAVVNEDQSFNLFPNPFAACKGACRGPVANASRHLLWSSDVNSGGNIALIVDRVVLHPAGAPTTKVYIRWRNNAPLKAPVVVASSATNNVVSMYSSGTSSYRTLIKVMNVNAALTWTTINEKTALGANDYHIDGTQRGYRVQAQLPAGRTSYDVFTALNFDKAAAGTTQLNDAAMVTCRPSSGSCAGACAGQLCLVLGPRGLGTSAFVSRIEYVTPSTMKPSATHVVGDLDASVQAYDVCVNGAVLQSGVVVDSSDAAVEFSLGVGWSGAVHVAVVVSGSGCPASAVSSAPTKKPTKRPTSTPTKKPTSAPTKRPTTKRPTKRPTLGGG